MLAQTESWRSVTNRGKHKMMKLLALRRENKEEKWVDTTAQKNLVTSALLVKIFNTY